MALDNSDWEVVEEPAPATQEDFEVVADAAPLPAPNEVSIQPSAVPTPGPLMSAAQAFSQGLTYEFADDLLSRLDPEAKARFKAGEEAHPVISGLANLTGAIASPNLLGKPAAVGKAAKAAWQLGKAGLEGAVAAYGKSDGQSLSDNLEAAAEGAVMSAGLAGAFKGLGAAAKKGFGKLLGGGKLEKAFKEGETTGKLITDPRVQEQIAADVGRISEDLSNNLDGKIKELGALKGRLLEAHKGASIDIEDDLVSVYQKLDSLKARKNLTPDELAGLNRASEILDRVDDSINQFQGAAKNGIDPVTRTPLKISGKQIPIEVLDGFKQQAQQDAFNSNLKNLNPAAFSLLKEFQSRAAKKIENYDLKQGSGDLARVNKALTSLYEMRDEVQVPAPTAFTALLNPQNVASRATAGKGGKTISNYTTFMRPLRELNPDAKTQYLSDFEPMLDAKVTVPLEKLRFLKEVSGTLPQAAEPDFRKLSPFSRLTQLLVPTEDKRLQLANWLGKNSNTLSKLSSAADTATQFLATRGPAAVGAVPEKRGLSQFESNLGELGLK